MNPETMATTAAECQRLARETALLQNSGGTVSARTATALTNALLNCGNTMEQWVREHKESTNGPVQSRQ